jgi:hypothetical protein
MTSVTLDMNCVIDLEEERPAAEHVRMLLSLHDSGRVQICVSAIAASERKPGGTYAENFREFQSKLARLGLGTIRLLKPPMMVGVTYLDWSVVASDSMLALEKDISAVLFPGVESNYADYSKQRGLPRKGQVRPDPKWLNPKCDVYAMWAHIWYGCDLFVTTDQNFHKETKKPRLIALGAGNIVLPEEAAIALNTGPTRGPIPNGRGPIGTEPDGNGTGATR